MEVQISARQKFANRVAILATINDELSPNTRKAYGQALASLTRFYEKNEWALFPTNMEGLDEELFITQLLSYFQELAEQGRTYSTLNKTLSAVKHLASYTNPRAFSALGHKPVRAFMEGLSRQNRTHTPKKAEALTVEQLTVLYKHLKGHTPRHIRDKALISLGVATALRSQNLAELTLSDLSPAITIDGLLVRVKWSKTDQKGKGQFIPVARVPKKRFDPVAAVQEWVQVLASYGYTADTHPNMPLFPNIRGHRGVQTSPILHPSITITDMLRTHLVASGATTDTQVLNYSSHSLRASFITLSSQAGVNEADIAAVSGHKSMTTLRSYDRSTVERHAQTKYLT
jgi:integrase